MAQAVEVLYKELYILLWCLYRDLIKRMAVGSLGLRFVIISCHSKRANCTAYTFLLPPAFLFVILFLGRAIHKRRAARCVTQNGGVGTRRDAAAAAEGGWSRVGGHSGRDLFI